MEHADRKKARSCTPEMRAILKRHFEAEQRNGPDHDALRRQERADIEYEQATASAYYRQYVF